ncbi:MAG TPA: GNVR domain-containing protein [Gemmatimonadaceae bacterium]|nr:GNVR domain-containing protein [Gemmatimonadaceae bacterium]
MAEPRDEMMHAAPGTSRDELTFFAALTPLVRHWRLALAIPVSFGVVGAIVSLFVPATYVASTSFTPQAQPTQGLPASLGALAGLAGQLGLANASPGVSPEFFASVLESRELLHAILNSEFQSTDQHARRPLLELLRVKGRSENERVANGIRRLRALISSQVDGRTGIVTVTVRQRSARLAADVANHLTQLLNEFNLERRRSQAREQARFVASRLETAEVELEAAEQDVQRFLQTNRQFQGSPLLEFEYARLNRIVQTKQEVYTSLAKAYEDARIAEVRDTPVLTIIDRAVPPHRRAGPRRKLYVLVAAFFGAISALALILAIAPLENEDLRSRPDYRQFAEALAGARSQLRGFVGRRRASLEP